MSATLVLPQPLADELAAVAGNALETAGVLLASIVETDSGDLRLLGRRVEWVSDSAYRRRERDSLGISSDGYVPALRLAEDIAATPIWVHTHPGLGAWPVHSTHDRLVDAQLADLFRLRSGSQYYGALTISPRAGAIAFTGHLQPEAGPMIPMHRLWTVGDRFHLSPSFNSQSAEPSPVFDRNVRAFGGAVQQTLADLRVAIVGCGGVGSAVAEQLVRLGIRHLTLVDPDLLSGSNVTRVYGSTPADIGQPKVDILARHLLRIAPDARVAHVRSKVTIQSAARRLTSCDLVFGCTDDNGGRLVLSRLATYFLTPIIDSGILLTADKEGILRGIDGRVTLLVPGQACLVCRGRIDLGRAAAELLTPEERTRREDEGYAPALGRVEPAVATYTTLVAATAVSELLERLIGYGPEPRPSEVLLRCHDREISTNIAAPRERHYCHPSSGKLGIGPTTPFLDQTWSA